MRLFARSDILGPDAVTAAGASGLMAGLMARLSAALAALSQARADRRNRAALAALDDHMLRDIGLARHDVEHAIGRRASIETHVELRG